MHRSARPGGAACMWRSTCPLPPTPLPNMGQPIDPRKGEPQQRAGLAAKAKALLLWTGASPPTPSTHGTKEMDEGMADMQRGWSAYC